MFSLLFISCVFLTTFITCAQELVLEKYVSGILQNSKEVANLKSNVFLYLYMTASLQVPNTFLLPSYLSIFVIYCSPPFYFTSIGEPLHISSL